MEAGTGRFDHLREHSIGLPQVLFQSITHMAPAAAVAYSIYISVPDARQALPLSVGLALIACLCAATAIGQLAIMRLDGDYYDSTMDVLKNLYDKVSPGGFVIIDDYGEEGWANCRGATDDFRRAHDITSPLQRVDSKCFFWRKS